MRTITTSVMVYTFAELDPQAQERAVEQVQEREIQRDWHGGETELIESTMMYVLAGKLKAPGWDAHGEVDFPGITNVKLLGFDLGRGQSVTVAGSLNRTNAPGLPWVEGIDSVELVALHRDGTEVNVMRSDPECDCPVDTWAHEAGCAPIAPEVTAEQTSTMEDAVTDALHAGWTAGRDELEYRHSAEYARELAENGSDEFTVDGTLYR